MDATSLIGNAQDAYVTGLTAQVTKKAKADAPMASAMTPDQEKKLRDTAQDFEAFFIGQMMEHMMAGMETDPTFGGGPGEDMWRSMLNQEYGKEIAKTGKLGVADHVMRGMLAAQEQRDAESGRAPKKASSGEELQERTQPLAIPTRRTV
jgi:peptidoglycan hydrolase FlgJ